MTLKIRIAVVVGAAVLAASAAQAEEAKWRVEVSVATVAPDDTTGSRLIYAVRETLRRSARYEEVAANGLVVLHLATVPTATGGTAVSYVVTLRRGESQLYLSNGVLTSPPQGAERQAAGIVADLDADITTFMQSR